MVNFSHLSTLPLVAMGVFTSQVTAAPAVAEAAEVTPSTTTRFSFAKWVDSITADPSTALSPEEAVQAYLDTSTVNATTLPGTTAGTEKRRRAAEAVCKYWTGGRDRAKVADVAVCIHYLAAAGEAACPGRLVTVGPWPQRIWCNWNGALFWAAASDDVGTYPTCKGIARMYGAIVDACAMADGTVDGYMLKDLTGTKTGGYLGYVHFSI
ncbi:uncharacterized protein B0T23DRAFT_421485 [Neurospora hispaniola]|uniref:Uncharacterized protein n=1 Tax=Neurospora hispaniola TaxID=588809 RepID=A0AAJ0I6V0_9PEZI|nr:hypothetical protein B0T23DRAFT_421485 [Neurospora hispaniola]